MITDPVAAMTEFAQKYIRPKPELASREEFPGDIWAGLAEQGFLKPERVGEVSRTACAMVRSGGNLGLGLSFLLHHLTAQVYYDLTARSDADVPGPPADSGHYRTPLSLAVSEPAVGSHPKFMTASARAQGEDAFILNGEKTYITNGPIARGFIVVAVTGEEKGQRAFSAFFVDRDTPGLEVLPAMDLPFFKPSPHGGIRMNDVRVARKNLLGREGRAFEEIVLPFRRTEDAAMTFLVRGAMGFLLASAAEHLPDSAGTSPEALVSLGTLAAITDTGELLSESLLEAVAGSTPVKPGVALYFRTLSTSFAAAMEEMIKGFDIPIGAAATSLLNDLKMSARIGKSVAGIRLQKLGRQII